MSWRGPSADVQVRRYETMMGRLPPVPRPDDPLAWQWEYRGTEADRERLEDELASDRHVSYPASPMTLEMF